jgi:cell wall-associated NlpC family hydrolase
MMTNRDFILKWTGTPWKDRAIGPDYIDCWGLVYRYFQEVLGIEVSKPGDHENIITGFQSEISTGMWERVIRPQSGIVFMCFRGETPQHVGIVLDSRHVIHAVGNNERSGTVSVNTIRAIEKMYGKCKFYARVK